MAAKSKPPVAKTHEGERIAKVLSRGGVASRREAERMIEAGEVAVNGKVITSPALNVTDKDRIEVRGELLGEPEPARLWLYYKPDGLVTSNSDEKGRDTVFDNLPPDMPRVMSVGRLDLNSEGLLLLTNDGELKRRLELPSTGWLRKYRVRINGNPVDPDLEPLRKGITVDGEKFQAMSVVLDRIQGANAWLTVGIREGKNREIRRAMSAINLTVNRLIRISYGPFRLGDLEPGQVEEIKGKVLREQLGEGPTLDDAGKPKRLVTRNVGARLKPGEALKQLSTAWQKATRPPAAKSAAKPAPRLTTVAVPKRHVAKVGAGAVIPRTTSTSRP
ncbi:MAG: pseudouridine synthase, partial [Paracoccaceae bacterium]